MNAPQENSGPVTVTIITFDDCSLVASQFGEAKKGAIILLHGGGQTRHAWSGAARTFERAGYSVLCPDLRGHGDSDCAPNSVYSYQDYARDTLALSDWVEENTGVKPHLIGASLGGVAGLIAVGQLRHDGFASLTLVDVAPKISRQEFESIRKFMLDGAKRGFEDLSEAASFLSGHVPRPNSRSATDYSGLKRNMRQGKDGRWRWHWDPAFVETLYVAPEKFEQELVTSAKNLSIPVHFMRGSESKLVTQESAKHFCDLVPQIHYTEIEGARHMMTGDQNDIFVEAALSFLSRLE